jgi:hypothetical protein
LVIRGTHVQQWRGVKYATLNHRHPTSDAKLFSRYDALYRGGRAFRARVGDFLPQNPLESGQVYAMRKAECAFRSYVGPIVDFYSAELFASPLVVRVTTDGEPVDADPFYASFKEAVDATGTDLEAFLKGQFITAMVKGCSWWLAEFPDDDNAPATDRNDWAARGLGAASLRAVEPDDVLDWQTDPAGMLQWVITHSKEARRDDPRAERLQVTETWRIFDAVNVETFRVTYDPKKPPKATDDIPSIGAKPHRFPRVPLVQMRLPDGLWLLNRTAEAQEEHFRLSAALSWAMKRACYPMAVFKSKDGEQPKTGAGLVTTIGLEDELEWIAPPTSAFDSLQSAIKDSMTEIHRIAQQMSHSVDNSAATAGRSGDSKDADNVATEICLHAYAALVKGAAEETYELVSDGRDDFDLVFSIEGMTRFSRADIAATLDNIARAQGMGIPSDTLAREMACKAADLLLPDASQGVKDTIREEIQSAPAKAPPAPPKPADAPPAPGGDPVPTNG